MFRASVVSLAVLFGGIACVGGSARAEMMTYEISATGSGSLGVTSFTNAQFVITSIADTTNITSPKAGIYYITNDSSTVQVSGVGTGTFAIPTITVANQNSSRVGISAPLQNLGILFVETNAAFVSYTLDSSIGPVIADSTPFSLMQDFNTTSGDFKLSAVTSATFQATLQPASVPEPSTFTLFGIGAIISLACRGRKSRR